MGRRSRWDNEEQHKKTAEEIRKLTKKGNKFMLADIIVKMGWKVRNHSPKPTPYHADTEKIREIMRTTPSETHDSLAHEVFHNQKRFGFGHLYHLFGSELYHELSSEYIRQNWDLSIKEVAKEFNTNPSFLRTYSLSKQVWRDWIASKPGSRQAMIRRETKAKILGKIDLKEQRRRETIEKLNLKLKRGKKGRVVPGPAPTKTKKRTMK
jgi:hypothetical protein